MHLKQLFHAGERRAQKKWATESIWDSARKKRLLWDHIPAEFHSRLVASSGDYLCCYNDISHKHTIGNINALSIDEALSRRENMQLIPELCNGCNMKERYKPAEIARVLTNYARGKLISVRAA